LRIQPSASMSVSAFWMAFAWALVGFGLAEVGFEGVGT
jgi:hypothetical protein